MAKYTGGHYTKPETLIKEGGPQKHTNALDVDIPDRVLDCVHIHQATPWEIDYWMLRVLEEAFEKNIKLTWADPSVLPMPPKMEEGTWELMSEEEKRERKKERAKVYTINNKNVGRRLSSFQILQTAAAVNEGKYFWLPYNLDFRGRLYSISGIAPSPQGSDQSLALLVKHFGEALTDEGRYWLKVGIATEYGHDKLSFDDRVKWTETNINVFKECVDDPIKTIDLWQHSDKPLKFLGLLKEYVEVTKNKNYKVRRGVSLDGTCNGFQHMAALMLDEKTAKYVNLLPGPRQDIYQMVADAMNIKLAKSGALYRADRKSVKRAVMTTPYGLSRFGMADQLIQDQVLDWSVPVSEFRNVLADTISELVHGPERFMAWVQAVAKQLAEQGKPLKWVSPSGFVCQQEYKHIKYERINLLLVKGAKFRMQTFYGTPEDKLEVQKQVTASAPNVIHSFDAAHLVAVMTHSDIPKNPEGWPTTVHDSFNIHPNYVSILERILKETFVKQYKINQLNKLYEGWLEEDDSIPQPPAMGNLDIDQVLKSNFIFS